MPKDYEKVTRKPDWLKIKLHDNSSYAQVAEIVHQNSLHTICESGKCPNKAECWSMRTATFMIMGDVCTRNCKFCATSSGTPLPLDHNEPERVASAVKAMKLVYCVLTSVDRDDLIDGGARHWSNVVKTVKEKNPETKVEILIPDFGGNKKLIEQVCASGADVVGHNIECTESITPLVRSVASYKSSLDVLRIISANGVTAKSGLMLGLGEKEEDVLKTLSDLKQAGCSILTIGQYLQPSAKHYPVKEYVTPEQFEKYRLAALALGFDYVESAPLVRSSYMAHKGWNAAKKAVM